MIRSVPGLFALLLSLACQAQVPVIFDTDMDTDCDDAGALAILHALADRGEAKILATMVSSRYRWSAPCVERINRYYGRAGLPIGVPKREGRDTGNRGSRYAKAISDAFSGELQSNDDAPDAAGLYRRILANEPDGSVVIVTVGYVTNIRDLLGSGPDEWSTLSGLELARRKVKTWVCMGGRYPEHVDPAVYGNFKPDPEAAVTAARDWPGTVVFTGLGDDIQTGGELGKTPKENPVRRVYELYLGEKKTRPSWDPIAVLYAIHPEAKYWELRADGHNHIFENGTNQWREENDPRHALLLLKAGMKEPLLATLDALMSVPRDR